MRLSNAHCNRLSARGNIALARSVFSAGAAPGRKMSAQFRSQGGEDGRKKGVAASVNAASSLFAMMWRCDAESADGPGGAVDNPMFGPLAAGADGQKNRTPALEARVRKNNDDL